MREENPFELEVVSVRLVKDTPIYSEGRVDTSQKAVDLVGRILCEMDREVICIINLKSDLTPINCHFASVGAIDHAIASPRELLKSSILSNASSIIMVHNHPSGLIQPSRDDVRITDQLQKVTSMVDIPLIDHLIVGTDVNQFFSFKEKGVLPNPVMRYESDIKGLSWEKQIAERSTAR